MPVLPGGVLGVLGGGQLGRMTAMAAREMGYRVRVLDPDPECAARNVSDAHIVAPFDDVDAALELARTCDVVTVEIETIDVRCLRAIAEGCPVRPGAHVLDVVQDRVRQKTLLSDRGFPVGPFRVASDEVSIAEALRDLGPSFVKAARGGYDGRGQLQAEGPADAPEAARVAAGQACVVERALPIEQEISVMVARRPSGDVASYPPALNHHTDRILEWSVLPAPIDGAVGRRAEEIARTVAEALSVEGLLCVELFVVGGELLVNEVAPRPHNSYHASVLACGVSQFEAHVRAVCDLPLGATEALRPAAIANLLGELWQDGPPAFERALELPGVRLHLYGKRGARPGRKMGHLSATGTTPEEAIARVMAAKRALRPAR